ncbi:hypothetical protein [Acidiphilium sp. 34-64-41]|uniref:hypothetical protein n=1 Tax=Acidiphilium sp. 34-64-41 TaxID=1970297 RepID=UPI000BCD124F|nr:hypothetical protein [Acidiphilium sp. 34-64-41]OZB30544.1 MAG: hypothetical protein B7X49_02290 [Acidiphilium sp. 34-64-41]
MDITELRARIVAARRFHDAAIRTLDAKWKTLAADVKAHPDRAAQMVTDAVHEIGGLISNGALDDPEAGAARGTVKAHMRATAARHAGT